eukprot:SAG11_NODE_1301_length_5259_cov_8.758140_1_plen_155_part_00
MLNNSRVYAIYTTGTLHQSGFRRFRIGRNNVLIIIRRNDWSVLRFIIIYDRCVLWINIGLWNFRFRFSNILGDLSQFMMSYFEGSGAKKFPSDCEPIKTHSSLLTYSTAKMSCLTHVCRQSEYEPSRMAVHSVVGRVGVSLDECSGRGRTDLIH